VKQRIVRPLSRKIVRDADGAHKNKIAKADGRKRPLGIAALEDKIVQQAVVTILNQIYEVDFQGFSYGFRPGRSPHQALDALTVGLQRKRVNWVLDADIRGFFDNMSHECTMKFFGQRLRRLWWLILRLHSQRQVAWDRLLPIFTRWLPAPRVLHPYPVVRFLATHPRWEPYA
jgi:retron-type reverse transcriptase